MTTCATLHQMQGLYTNARHKVKASRTNFLPKLNNLATHIVVASD
jgi:hypothetical protein